MKKILSIILAALMLFTAAMAVSASEHDAEEATENATAAEEVQEEAEPAEETAAAEEPAAEEPAAEEPAAEESAAAEEAAPAENATAEAQPSQPGFEGVFAITGLLAVAYLVLGRRE